jgi:acyl dehydratase
MSEPITFESLKAREGQEIGVSDWVVISQERINQFAECTEDRQWIHIDAERASKESPFRTTIAHGYLTLSLIAGLALQLGGLPHNLQAAFNYGLDKVRFITAVKVGARVRLRSTLISSKTKATANIL